MKHKIHALLLAGLVLPAAQANTLIWSDNFNVADNTNFDGAPLTGRLSGTLGTTARLYSAKVQQQIRGNQLRMGPAAAGRVRFQTIATPTAWFNWAGSTEAANILADGGLRVEFDFTATDLTSTNWISFSIGHAGPATAEPTTRVNHAGTDYGILFRNNGATQRFVIGADQGVGVTTTPVLTPRHIVLDYAFASFADGTPVKVRATVDGVLVASNNFTWNGNAGALYMELECYNLDGTLFDNYTVSTVPVIYSMAFTGSSFASGIDPGNLVGTLSGSTYAKGPEASTFALVAGAGDTDNAKFAINGDQLEAGSYDFTQDPHGKQYFIRVQGTGTITGGTEEKAYVLTLIKDDDDDTLPDSWELSFSSGLTDLNGLLSGPGPAVGSGDFDGDGLSDQAEYNLSLGAYPNINPMLADTDSDTLTDNQEITGAAPRPATNPTLADTDKDGLNDNVESNSNIFIDASDSGTNPLVADTDADGARDGFEVVKASVPTNFSSRPALPSNFAVVALSDDASSGISTSKLYTHAVSGGAAVTVNGVNFGLLNAGTTPANFTWTSPSKLSLVANGSWVPASGGVTGPGLQSLLGSFAYSNLPNPGESQSYTLSGLTVGTTYELRLYIRQWDTVKLRPIDLVFTNGATVEQPYGALLEDRPGIVLNNGNDQSAYYLSYTYTAQATSLVINANIHLSSPVGSGALHLYGLSNESPAQLVISLAGTSFISGISPGGQIGTLSSETLTLPTEATTYEFVAGAGDADNAKFVIVGDQLQAGSYDFKLDPDGTQYLIRVKGTGTVSSFTQEKAFVLTLIEDDDADSLFDPWEITVAGNLTDLNGTGTNPGPGAGTGDFDGDGLTDIQEYNLRTTYPSLSPIIADSDDDGLSDGAELNPVAPRPVTSPIIADMDKDGLKDGIESNTGTFVDAADSGTSPLVADSDLDGQRDGFEVEKGSVPTDFASRPTLPAAFSLLPLTDDASTGISTLKTYTHALSGGGPATINGVVLEEVNPTLFPTNFAWTVSVGTRNEINPINNGGWVPATGGVTGPGLLNLLGGFAYHSSGEPAGFQTYTLSGLTVGETYHLTMFYRPWSVTNASFRPIDLIFTNGATVEQPFGGLPTDRPGIVLGNGNIHGAFALGYTYVAESTELVIKALVHESAMAASGSNHLYGLTNEVVSPYADWALSYGSALTDPTPAADPDGDTKSNLLEYGFGTNPTLSSTGPIEYVPGGSVTTPGQPVLVEDGGNYYAVFGRRKDYLSAGLTYTVQFSAGLEAGYWWDSPEIPERVTGASSSGDIEAMRVPFPGPIPTATGTGNARFFSVKVSQAP